MASFPRAVVNRDNRRAGRNVAEATKFGIKLPSRDPNKPILPFRRSLLTRRHLRAWNSGTRPEEMTVSLRQFAILFAVALLASALAGCGTINEKMSAGMGDYIPKWAGGLPADAPPRPGTAKYDAFMAERERQRLMPAAEREKEQKAQQPDQSGLDPVH